MIFVFFPLLTSSTMSTFGLLSTIPSADVINGIPLRELPSSVAIGSQEVEITQPVVQLFGREDKKLDNRFRVRAHPCAALLHLVGLAIRPLEEIVDFCCWILASSAPASREMAPEWRRRGESSSVVPLASLFPDSETSSVFSSCSL